MMSPHATVMPGYQSGPMWLLWPPDSWPANAPLALIAGDSRTYGLLWLPVPWQMVTLWPVASAGAAGSRDRTRAPITANACSMRRVLVGDFTMSVPPQNE